MKTLLFQGDSITDCGRTTCGGAGYPVNLWGPGYPGLIASELMGDQPCQWNIINRGISGNRVPDLYARWKIDCINLNPDILSILLGVNDTLHEMQNRNGVEVPRFDKIYRSLLDWCREKNPDIKFILMEPFLYPFSETDPKWLEEIRGRQEVVRKIAADYHAALVPLQQVFDDALKLAPKEYWFVDGIHPQPAGHRLIVKAWFKAAEKHGILS